jgi:RNA polymerase sigma-70 factor (ECF subfamily)
VGVRSDAELLVAWRLGNREAGEALMQRHYASILRYFELNASWAADDLAQRTFMACIERADHLRDSAAFRAYLMGIARRQLALHQRELARSRALRSFDAPSQRTQLSTLVARSREQLLALRALATLPRRPQMLLILYYWDGVSTPDLAQSFGVPTSTIRTRLARARDLLRHRMDGMLVSDPQVRSDQALHELLTSVVASDPRRMLISVAVER